MTNARTLFLLSSVLVGLSMFGCASSSDTSEEAPAKISSEPLEAPSSAASRPDKAPTKSLAAIPQDALKATLLVPNPDIPFSEPDPRVRAQMEGLGKDKIVHFGKDFPVPQRIDAVLRITNTSSETMSFLDGGDSTFLSLRLEGKDAWNGKAPGYCTEIYMQGRTITLAPGKHYDLKIATLSSGNRCDMHWAQANAKGDYQLSLGFHTWVSREGKPPVTGIRAKFDMGPVALRFI